MNLLSKQLELFSNPRRRWEWKKHGSCSGLDPIRYFEEEDILINHAYFTSLSETLHRKVGLGIKTLDLLKLFGGTDYAAALASPSCDLLELTTCWEKLADHSVGQQIKCPKYVLNSRGTKCESLSLQGCGTLASDLAQAKSSTRNEAKKISLNPK
jgi:hypothetical protein